ncbi:hypothetical protein AB0L99_15435, partial [Streptomyces sp. NPDC051954]|uniref:hypothetical protein n=1 Tax=Streptomyces sp. NPDC051954 TaxID=3155524 RepID=UPI00343AEAC3
MRRPHSAVTASRWSSRPRRLPDGTSIGPARFLITVMVNIPLNEVLADTGNSASTAREDFED